MFCEYLLKNAKAGDKESKEQFFCGNHGLVYCFMQDLRVPESDKDDFNQLCYIAFQQALESYPLDGINTFLSYYRRSVLHLYYLYRLEMAFPAKVSYKDYKEILTNGFDYEKFLDVSYYEYDELLTRAENETFSEAIWKEVKNVVGEYWYEFLRLRFVEQKSHEEIAKQFCFPEQDTQKSRSKQSWLFRKLRKSNLLQTIAKDWFEIKMQ